MRKSKRVRNPNVYLVPMRLGVTPVPISNTMVKTKTADGTMLVTVWESRWVPYYLKIYQPLEYSRGSNVLVTDECQSTRKHFLPD